VQALGTFGGAAVVFFDSLPPDRNNRVIGFAAIAGRNLKGH
jgi:hypothetical protein